MAFPGSIDELGVGNFDGEPKVIQYGPSAHPERVGMRWHEDPGVWVQARPRNTITMRDGHPITMVLNVDGVWYYLFHIHDTGNLTGGSNPPPARSYSWNPVAINHADAAFAAGLTLQENILARWWTWDSGKVMQLATVFFEIDAGDSISTLISAGAGSHLGTVIDSLPTLRRWQASGWHDSLTQTCTKQILAPHLYAKADAGESSDNFLESILVQWRWAGVPA